MARRLTERLARWTADRIIRGPVWTEEAETLIRKYGRPATIHRQQTQFEEMVLTTAHGLIVIPFGLLVALAGELGSVFGSDDAQSVIKIVGIAGLAWCGVGTLLHLIRYCAALFAHPPRGAQQQADDAITERSWPRGSSDADFLVQTLVAVAVAIAVALKA